LELWILSHQFWIISVRTCVGGTVQVQSGGFQPTIQSILQAAFFLKNGCHAAFGTSIESHVTGTGVFDQLSVIERPPHVEVAGHSTELRP